jgi:hypothetical protein
MKTKENPEEILAQQEREQHQFRERARTVSFRTRF